VTALAVPKAHAQQYWDGTSTSGDADGGTGDWKASPTNWDSAATGGTDQVWMDGEAVFGGTAGTVTVVGTQTTSGITFETSGYTATGDALSLGGATVDVGAGTATISSILTGSGLTKAGTGTLTLSGTNTYTGDTIITGGTLSINNGAA